VPVAAGEPTDEPDEKPVAPLEAPPGDTRTCAELRPENKLATIKTQIAVLGDLKAFLCELIANSCNVID
jgi:hypothetical protein